MRKLFSLIAAVLFAGSMMAEEATMTAGTNGSACTVNDVAGIKCGTSSKAGDMTITVGAGATKLSFYAAAWKGVSGLSLNLAADGVTISPASVSLTADDGISNNTPFTLSGLPENFKFEVELTGVTAETTIAVTSSAAKRFVVWGASYETGEVPPTPADTYTVAGSDAAIFGEAWNPALATNDMKKVNGIYKWEKAELNLAVGSIEFKVVKNHSWDIAYPAQNYVVNIAEAGEYTLTITFDPATEAVAAEAVKKEPLADPTNCAEAAAAALSVSANNELYNGGKEYTIEGYVTGIKTAYSDQFHNISFWMADTKDGGEVLQAYRAACASEADAPKVGDKVAVTGTLTKYGTTPEFSAGCTYVITEPYIPVEPTINYYVIGSMTEWNVDANYKLVANPAAEGEYMGEFTFANNDEFKIVGDDGSQLIWYPGGTDNNFKITEAGDYKITFNPAGNVEGWYEGYFNVVKKVIPQYEVAEAIAAGLAEGDEVLVRGVISKMQIKGKNFAKYGSVNIYVTDATDAEGEFEFFNCFSFNADTFRTTTPAYDAEGTTWEDLKKVVDENGNEFRLGDTIVAFGKYKLYNTTHELTACYITDLKPAPVEPAQDINVNMSDGLRYDDYVASDGWWQIYGSDEQYSVSISNVATTQAEGTYTIADLDADYTYITAINSTDTTHFVDGSVTLSIDAQTGKVTVAGTLVGDDGNNYIFNLQYIVPTPQETVNVNIQNAELIDYYADYGLYGVSGTDANGVYVQLAIWVDETFEGTFTEEDLDMQYIGSALLIGDEQVDIYTAAITVTPGNGGDYNITATLLCYNNKQYNVTMYVPGGEGIEETLAAGKAAKVLRDGQVLILKGDKTFNVMGTVVR